MKIFFDFSFFASSDLARVMSELGENLSEEEVSKTNMMECDMHLQVEEMMRWADKDGDGVVGMQEFSSMMQEVVRKNQEDEQQNEEKEINGANIVGKLSI